MDYKSYVVKNCQHNNGHIKKNIFLFLGIRDYLNFGRLLKGLKIKSMLLPQANPIISEK